MLVRKKTVAKTAVARVSALVCPRPVMKPDTPPPPPPPSPSPPSERCRRTTPISARTMIRWMMMTTVCMA